MRNREDKAREGLFARCAAWIAGVCLEDVPEMVLSRSEWPWWRRAVGRPPIAIRERAGAWHELRCELLATEKPRQRGPELENTGIFGESICRLDLLDLGWEDRPFSLNGRLARGTHIVSTSMECPAGRFCVMRRAASFSFDIAEVEGIAASKSSDRFFPTVDAFGADYAAYIKAPATEEGLTQMLSHREVRVARPDGTDRVTLRLWDGRLFLVNAGGSHHFAAAAYIARRTNWKVPLTADLTVHMLNEAAVRWLTTNFISAVVSKETARCVVPHCARILGSCYFLDLPEIIVRDACAVLLPIDGTAIGAVVDLLKSLGLVPLTPFFEQALVAQRQNAHRWRERLGEALVPPEDGCNAGDRAGEWDERYGVNAVSTQ